jgi:hypothetical protein
MMNKSVLLPALLALGLAGCQKEAADTSQMAPPPATSAAEPAPAPPHGPAPGSTAGPPEGSAMIAPVAPADQLGSDVMGFNDLRWGMAVDELRAAWKAPLSPAKLPDANACAFLTPPKGANDIAFMVQDGVLKRVDVRQGDTVAPGGGRIGMTANEIAGLYKDKLAVEPNKYTADAKDLIVTPSPQAQARIVFQTGPDSIVSRWHMGVPPQVLYVEGCG